MSTSWEQVGLVVLSTIAIVVAVIAYVRLIGLRSFSKMSSFDFAITVATGSIIATVAVTPSAALLNGIIGLGTMFGLQFVVALLRRRAGFATVVDNTPMLLMLGDRYLRDNMRTSRVTESDVKAKLRAANVLDYSMVRAVVLETTGDISVLHGDTHLDTDLLAGVRGADQS